VRAMQNVHRRDLPSLALSELAIRDSRLDKFFTLSRESGSAVSGAY